MLEEARTDLIKPVLNFKLNLEQSSMLSVQATIPNDVIAADVNGYTGRWKSGKVVSKGAVLALARRHIEAFEKREMSLEGEKGILMEKIQRLETECWQGWELTLCSD
jgi:hypothetical protein